MDLIADTASPDAPAKKLCVSRPAGFCSVTNAPKAVPVAK